jgi:hypothetical protein
MDKMPYEECPSFIGCDAPKCPLDPDIEIRVKASGDSRCKAQKPTRKRIGEKYASILPLKGMTSRENSGQKAWNNRTPEEKKLFVEQGLKRLKSFQVTK